MNLVKVQLNEKNNIQLFHDNNLNLKINLTVVVETEKGLQFGKVVSFCDDNITNKENDYNKILRISTKRDYLQYLENEKEAKEAIKKCDELIIKYNLKMRILDANYTLNKSQLTFRFVADERIDFRQLAKDLGSIFRTRIELRQVGIRDKAKEIGGLGSCGRKLCCCNFLNEFDSVSINMAKNQSLSLNPTKINGVCGRLLCCLKYENNLYEENKRKLPNVGEKIKTTYGEGKVISVDVLGLKYKVIIKENEIYELEVE